MNASREKEIHDIKTDFIKLSFLNKVEFIKLQISLLDDLIEISNKSNHYKNDYNENALPSIKKLKNFKKNINNDSPILYD